MTTRHADCSCDSFTLPTDVASQGMLFRRTMRRLVCVDGLWESPGRRCQAHSPLLLACGELRARPIIPKNKKAKGEVRYEGCN